MIRPLARLVDITRFMASLKTDPLCSAAGFLDIDPRALYQFARVSDHLPHVLALSVADGPAWEMAKIGFRLALRPGERCAPASESREVQQTRALIRDVVRRAGCDPRTGEVVDAELHGALMREVAQSEETARVARAARRRVQILEGRYASRHGSQHARSAARRHASPAELPDNGAKRE